MIRSMTTDICFETIRNGFVYKYIYTNINKR